MRFDNYSHHTSFQTVIGGGHGINSEIAELKLSGDLCPSEAFLFANLTFKEEMIKGGQ